MKTLSLLSLAFLVACGGKPGTDEDATDSGVANDSGDTSDTEDTEAAAVEIVPEEGVYIADLIAFTQDECMAEQGDWEELLEGDIALRFTLAGSDFYMEPLEEGEADEAYTCTTVGEIFLCPIETNENEIDENADAVFVLKMDVVGEWTSDTTIEGSLNLDYTCRGADCESALEDAGAPMDIPCATKVSIEGSKTE